MEKYFKNLVTGNKRDSRFKQIDPRAVRFMGWDKKAEELLIEHNNGVQSIHRRVIRIDLREDPQPPKYKDIIEPDIEVLAK